MRFTPALFLLSMAAMCGKDSDDSATDDSDSPVETVSPDEGHWTATAATPISDTCGIFDEQDTGSTEAGGFTLAMTGDTTFTITLEVDDGGEPLLTACTLTGFDFACATFVRDQIDYTDRDYEAVVTIEQTITGTFVDETNLGAISVLAVSCAGVECPELSTATTIPFPCSATLENTASHDI